MKEIFIHVATYCGAPAALDSFRIAKKVLAEAPASWGRQGKKRPGRHPLLGPRASSQEEELGTETRPYLKPAPAAAL